MKNRFAVTGFTCFGAFFISSFLKAYLCFALFGAGALISVILLLLKKNTIAVVAVTSAASFLIFGAYSSLFIEPCEKLYGETLNVTGRIKEIGNPDNDTVSLVISGEANNTPVTLALYTTDSNISVGDKVSFEGRFTPFRNNTNFSERDYNYSKGIFLKAYPVSEIEITEEAGFNPFGFIGAYSEYLKGIVRERLEGDNSALLTAIFFGDKKGLSYDLSSSVRKSGVAHIAAVSGMHLCLIVTILVSLLSCTPLRGRNKLCFGIIAVIILTLMVFFNMTASVRRSGIMLIIYYAALLFRRKTAPLNSLGLAVLLIILIEPYAIRDTGLILSLCGTYGAGVLAPALSVKFKDNAFLPIKEALMVSLCASISTLPVASLVFGGVSLLSVPTSLIIYPFFFIALIFMLILAFSGGLLAAPCLFIAGLCAKAIASICSFLGGFDYSFITFPEGIVIPIITIAALIAVPLFMELKRKRLVIASIAVSLCLAATVILIDRIITYDDAIVSVLSDGSGYALSVKTKEGVTVILSEKNEKLCKLTRDIMTEYNTDELGLLCIAKDSDSYIKAFDSIKYMELCTPAEEKTVYTVNDDYKVELENNTVTLDIRGNRFILAPSGTEGLTADFIVYSGYKKAFGNFGSSVTIFSDKRFYNMEDPIAKVINSYYETAEMHIKLQDSQPMKGMSL
ncbi:MAG: ComEC/Rec2 family competence protein [Ruminiclostridium sp.]